MKLKLKTIICMVFAVMFGAVFKANAVFTSLHLAARTGNLSAFIQTQRNTMNRLWINERDDRGRSPLHYAVLGGNLDIIRRLVRIGEADVNATDNENMSAVLLAAHMGNLRVVRCLVEEFGACVLGRDNTGKTALHFAVISGNLDMVKYLLKRCCIHLNSKDNDSKTPLYQAVELGELEIAKYLIDNDANIDLTDSKGNGLLFCALRLGDLNIVRYLIEEIGMSPKIRSNGLKNVLHIVAESGNMVLANYLLCGDLGSEMSDEVCVKALSEDFDEDAMSDEGRVDDRISGLKFDFRSALDDGKNTDTIISAPKVDANMVNSVNIKLRTPLYVAARFGNIEIADLLLKKGAKIDAKDSNDNTPLFYAVVGGHLNMVKYLIEHGANINAQNTHGETVLHLAVAKKRKEIICYLIGECDVDINIRDKMGRTPISMANEPEIRCCIDDIMLNKAIKNQSTFFPGFTLRDECELEITH